MGKHNTIDCIAELQSLLDSAKDCLADEMTDDGYLLLQQAKRELNALLWRMCHSPSAHKNGNKENNHESL